jgi:hypothetical protein
MALQTMVEQVVQVVAVVHTTFPRQVRAALALQVKVSLVVLGMLLAVVQMTTRVAEAVALLLLVAQAQAVREMARVEMVALELHLLLLVRL